MKVYFVRHGEGEHNVNKVYSTPHFNLTQKGIKQAESLADRLINFPIELILSSPYQRTKQTSEIIRTHFASSSDKQKAPEVIFTDLLEELKRPSEISGKSWEDPEIIKIRQLMYENFHKKDWHFSDEENFYDLKQRALKFIEYLEKFEQKHILIVSHINMIKMIVLTMMFAESLSPDIFSRAYDFLTLSTSGLTICQKTDNTHNYFGTERKTLWELITWNDQSHLG